MQKASSTANEEDQSDIVGIASRLCASDFFSGNRRNFWKKVSAFFSEQRGDEKHSISSSTIAGFLRREVNRRKAEIEGYDRSGHRVSRGAYWEGVDRLATRFDEVTAAEDEEKRSKKRRRNDMDKTRFQSNVSTRLAERRAGGVVDVEEVEPAEEVVERSVNSTSRNQKRRDQDIQSGMATMATAYANGTEATARSIRKLAGAVDGVKRPSGEGLSSRQLEQVEEIIDKKLGPLVENLLGKSDNYEKLRDQRHQQLIDLISEKLGRDVKQIDK